MFYGWQNVEMLSVPLSSRPKYYCEVASWSAQYEAPVLLFVPTPFISSYYGGMSVQASEDDKSRVRTVALGRYVFMAGTVLVASAKDGPPPRYYTVKPRFDPLRVSVLFLLSNMILDALKYFRLHRFAICMGTDPVRTGLAVHRRFEIDWTKTALYKIDLCRITSRRARYLISRRR